MLITADSEKIRYTGRWNIGSGFAESTANGSYFEFMFEGEGAVIRFDTSSAVSPAPHIYICVDNGAYIEASLDEYIRIRSEEGLHSVCVVMKSSVESQRRWTLPIEAKVSLLQIEADSFVSMPEDKRPVIEFIGDSITEGISIYPGCLNYGGNRDMVYWDDSLAGYAWQTAKLLNLRPVIMGYGCLGVTKGGAGGVPPVGEAYLFYSEGCPVRRQKADFIVINHGTNDRSADRELFKQKYYDFLGIVRKENPAAKIISLTPFSGCLAAEICETVEAFNRKQDDQVFYIDSTGWIESEPIHPLSSGHKTVSQNLAARIREALL